MLNEASIVCIAKNEESFINEWIYYHIKLGFSKIIIYDNSDNYSLNYLNHSWRGRVKVIHFPSNNNLLELEKIPKRNTQEDAYNHYIKTYKKQKLLYKWVAFLDCDEFIVLTQSDNIVHFLQTVPFNKGCMPINWWFFGSNGHTIKSNDLVLQRFNKKSEISHIMHKNIVCIEDVKQTLIPGHYFESTKGYYDPDGCPVEGINTSNPDKNSRKIYLAHYFVKSQEEFKEKIERGQKHVNRTNRTFDEFYLHDFNETVDSRPYYLLTFHNPVTIMNLKNDELDTHSYWLMNPDLHKNCVCSPEDLQSHYFTFGYLEERPWTNLNFPYAEYKIKYPELKEQVNNFIWYHWLVHSKNFTKIN